ncbi:hypothetical protein B1218_36015, partial [Pseudomonas ogarae]
MEGVRRERGGRRDLGAEGVARGGKSRRSREEVAASGTDVKRTSGGDSEEQRRGRARVSGGGGEGNGRGEEGKQQGASEQGRRGLRGAEGGRAQAEGGGGQVEYGLGGALQVGQVVGERSGLGGGGD